MKNAANIQEALRNAKHVLAESEGAVADITRIVNNYEGSEGKKRPFYIYCAATGQKKGMSQTPVFEKRLAKFGGDILTMFAQYKSRDAGAPVIPVAPTATEPTAMEKLAEIMSAEPVSGTEHTLAGLASLEPVIIDGAITVIEEPVIEVPVMLALPAPTIEVPEVVVGSESIIEVAETVTVEETPEVAESPKARKNRLRREAAATKRAAENAIA